MKLLLAKTGKRGIDQILVEDKNGFNPLCKKKVTLPNIPFQKTCVDLPYELVRMILWNVFQFMLIDRRGYAACQLSFIDKSMMQYIHLFMFGNVGVHISRKIRNISDRLVFLSSCFAMMFRKNTMSLCPVLLGYVPIPAASNAPEAMVFRQYRKRLIIKRVDWDHEYLTNGNTIADNPYYFRQVVMNGALFTRVTWIFHNKPFTTTIDALAVEYPIFIFKYRHNIVLDDIQDLPNSFLNKKDLQSWKRFAKLLKIIYPSCGVYLVQQSSELVLSPPYLKAVHVDYESSDNEVVTGEHFNSESDFSAFSAFSANSDISENSEAEDAWFRY